MQLKNITRVIFITILILMIPLISMQFTEEVNWNFGDFLIAGVIIFAAGNLMVYLNQFIKNPINRTVAIFTVVILLLLIWAELAVGIIPY